jgi:hypothetical protein
MARPYGKFKRRLKKTQNASPASGDAFKVKFLGKDNTPLSMADAQQGMLELIRKLRGLDTLRIKRATLYVTFIDGDGKEVMPDAKGEWEIRPYKSAAEEYKI